jgi:triphosphoribosyl-dephospho-CoA synthase
VSTVLILDPTPIAPRTAAQRTPNAIAELAVAALRAEAELTPKPGLVDRRGSGAHTDMDLHMLLRSAEALREGFASCARAAQQMPLGVELRARIGVIGRAAERRMLAATGGVNTHRGALWCVGLLAAGVARYLDAYSATRFAAALAVIPDPVLRPATDSHGARARQRYGAPGAVGEARGGFPHVVGHALPILRRARARGVDETTARLDALLAVMASLEDTCLLHRGGSDGLAAIRRGARGVLAAGGSATAAGRRRLAGLDVLAQTRRLSPGGSGDLLSAALFLDSLPTDEKALEPPCKL